MPFDIPFVIIMIEKKLSSIVSFLLIFPYYFSFILCHLLLQRL